MENTTDQLTEARRTLERIETSHAKLANEQARLRSSKEQAKASGDRNAYLASAKDLAELDLEVDFSQGQLESARAAVRAAEECTAREELARMMKRWEIDVAGVIDEARAVAALQADAHARTARLEAAIRAVAAYEKRVHAFQYERGLADKKNPPKEFPDLAARARAHFIHAFDEHVTEFALMWSTVVRGNDPQALEQELARAVSAPQPAKDWLPTVAARIAALLDGTWPQRMHEHQARQRDFLEEQRRADRQKHRTEFLAEVEKERERRGLDLDAAKEFVLSTGRYVRDYVLGAG